MFKKWYKTGILVFAVALTLGVTTNLIKLPIKIETRQEDITDFNDNRKLLGASHYVFLARISDNGKQIKSDGGIDTLYNAEIITNVKGKLAGTVTIKQQGGYKNGILIIPENTGLVKKNLIYLLATRYNEEMDCYTVISHPNGTHKLEFGQFKTVKNETLSSLVPLFDDMNIAKIFKEAYKNEILLQADIETGRTYNHYVRLPITE